MCVNPCLTKDSIISTDEGPKRLESLIGKKFNSYLKSNEQNSQFEDISESTEEGFFKTGNKPVYLLKTKEGHELKLTDNHLIKNS